MALTLRRLAEQSPWTLAELQRQFAYDRFLERLNARDDGWVLKGATAPLSREVSSRTAREVDVYRRAGLLEPEIALRALDMGDWFTFDAGKLDDQQSWDWSSTTSAPRCSATVGSLCVQAGT